MLRKIEGIVQKYRAIDVRNVQLEIQGTNNVIDLNVRQPWILKNGDYVVVAGEDDGRSGKFYGYAYRNDTVEAFGKSDPGLLLGYRYIFDGSAFLLGHLSRVHPHTGRFSPSAIRPQDRSGRLDAVLQFRVIGRHRLPATPRLHGAIYW